MNNSIREQIAVEIRNNIPTSISEKTANSILALPSGLEVVQLCDNCYCGRVDTETMSKPFALGGREFTDCEKCHGTGVIVRDLTIQETIELCKHYIKKREEEKLPVFYNGERVRVKK